MSEHSHPAHERCHSSRPGWASMLAERDDQMRPTPASPDPTPGEEGLSEADARIVAGRIKHGVGSSEDFPGNVCHLVSPIVGFMRLRQRDGKPLDDLDHVIDRLSLVLDMARQENARTAALAAEHAAEIVKINSVGERADLIDERNREHRLRVAAEAEWDRLREAVERVETLAGKWEECGRLGHHNSAGFAGAVRAALKDPR